MAQQEMVVVVALLVLAAASPVAYGQLNGASITGSVCCTSSGNCAPGSVGIPGVNVSLSCQTLFGTVVTLVQNVTNASGIFILNVNNLLGIVNFLFGNLLPCNVFLKVPLNSTVCPIFNATQGIISGIPVLVSTIVDPVTGRIGNFTVPVFTNITVGR